MGHFLQFYEHKILLWVGLSFSVVGGCGPCLIQSSCPAVTLASETNSISLSTEPQYSNVTHGHTLTEPVEWAEPLPPSAKNHGYKQNSSFTMWMLQQMPISALLLKLMHLWTQTQYISGIFRSFYYTYFRHGQRNKCRRLIGLADELEK